VAAALILRADRASAHEPGSVRARQRIAMVRRANAKPIARTRSPPDRRITVNIDRDEDGVWVVECPANPRCVSQGDTKEQAFENIKEAIAACLEVRAELGLPLTIETRQVEVMT